MAGYALQATALGLLAAAGWPYLAATAVAVEAAVLHNFYWHDGWTWHDRRQSPRSWAARLMKYHVTTALTSIAGNIVITAGLVELADTPVVLANLAAVASMAAINFVAADRWIFAPGTIGLAALLVAAPQDLEASGPSEPTLVAWEQFVADAEGRLHECPCDTESPRGRTVQVAGGSIHQWRGSVFVKDTTVDQVLHALQHPGTPPPQEEVLDSQVLSRDADTLRVYVKMTRRAIVRVTYDTEHLVTFSRASPASASSRSIATRIAEVDGGDRGFLWRLNAYWRYTQEADGVRIDLESLSLSRRIPAVLKVTISPIINRIGRESAVRTLESLQRYLETARTE
jgi:putative flippase GtrA